MKLTSLLFFCSLLLTLQTSISAPIPHQIQPPTDNPHDEAIRVKVHTKYEYCYTPTFVNGESYIYLNNCSASSALPARYDVLQRVSWNVNNVWLCMTAPSSVTGIDGKSTADWDYLLLRPCVINDANQRWIITGNAFHTADGRFRVKDYKWYLYISKDSRASYDHRLVNMNKWANTVAPPVNLNTKTFLGWNFISGSTQTRYYVTDDGSRSELFDLYYNPENGHIARYFPSSRAMSCMVSQQAKSESWNWVKWLSCKETISNNTKNKDIGFWDLSQLNGSEGPILDYLGNLLRVTQYGSNWGFPYTATSDYITKQESQYNHPTSDFIFDYDIERWNRFVNGNLGDTLTYCPAPGTKKNVTQTAHIREKRSLPPSFELTEEWKKRLWQIARSNIPGTTPIIAYCGPCMLQTLQMLAELQEYHYSHPPRDGEGYFFNTAPNTNLFISFRARFPLLAERLHNTENYANVPLYAGESSYTRTTRITRSAALMLLPNYDWRPSAVVRTHEEMIRVIQNMFTAPSGTLWYLSMVRTSYTGTSGHAQPILRTRDGLVLIPTNTARITFERYIQRLTPITTAEEVFNNLTRGGILILHSLATIQMALRHEISLDFYLSQRDCTGEGDGRRGSGLLPRAALFNQCLSGRCAIQ
ncbi:DUF1561 family protein [Bartonella bacilliformis]|uniref:Ricin B lectin domain-containing protein n=2 Tax=Bartonella bacilliformis TaxID=774 RepID=A0A072R3L5_BARBA|nr:DUF1561 family protein [Bartonella bacilliformis]KEG18492.1 hypothetical protein H710_01117 [Bartonella bacilliformis Ver097]KEG20350.1 hypothetical protein H710_00431 [Bartonella bacilliformis Ver097]